MTTDKIPIGLCFKRRENRDNAGEKIATKILRGSVHRERAHLTRLVLGGGGGGRPDYLQKLKVPEGYEKMIDYSNI